MKSIVLEWLEQEQLIVTRCLDTLPERFSNSAYKRYKEADRSALMKLTNALNRFFISDNCEFEVGDLRKLMKHHLERSAKLWYKVSKLNGQGFSNASFKEMSSIYLYCKLMDDMIIYGKAFKNGIRIR
jgi:hypothetical protein